MADKKYVATANMTVVLKKATPDLIVGKNKERGKSAVFFKFERGQVVTGKHSTTNVEKVYTAKSVADAVTKKYGGEERVTVAEVEAVLAAKAKDPTSRLITQEEYIKTYKGADVLEDKKKIESLSQEVEELRKQLAEKKGK